MGGLAGVVALSTKEKGNVIPGVAIATALMPPLCTAGYGLATGNLVYFLGAFYLYFINSVFISLATFAGVRVMHFQRKEFVDKKREKKVRQYIIPVSYTHLTTPYVGESSMSDFVDYPSDLVRLGLRGTVKEVKTTSAAEMVQKFNEDGNLTSQGLWFDSSHRFGDEYKREYDDEGKLTKLYNVMNKWKAKVYACLLYTSTSH